MTLIASLFLAAINPVGGYQADFSQAKGSKDVLKAVFGLCPLRVRPNGEFHVIPERYDGFWRMHNGRLVLVHRRFFNLEYATPDAVLKRSWPKDQLQGFVMDVRADGSLVLPKLGDVEGPVIFRRLPARSVAQLVQITDKIESADQVAEQDAWYELLDLVRVRWRDLLNYIGDERQSVKTRTWACYFLESLPKEGASQAASLLAKIKPGSQSDRQSRVLARALTSNLARLPYPETAHALLAEEARLNIGATTIAGAIGKAKLVSAKSKLVDILSDKSEYARSTSLNSLALLGAAEFLPAIMPLVNDPKPSVRAAAWAAVLDLSADANERSEAVRQLAKLFDSDTFVNGAIIEALGRSRLASAVPHLAYRLLEIPDPREQMDAAEALGNLKLPQARLALLEAKKLNAGGKMPTGVNSHEGLAEMRALTASQYNLSHVKKAVAEALWKQEHG